MYPDSLPESAGERLNLEVDPTEDVGALVAFGGGHGLAATLSAARRVASRLTAVVTVADDGGSSGRLRRELGILPPGDLRMALCALAGGSAGHQDLASLFQHRYGGNGALAGHAVGNLVFAGLWEQLAEPVEALRVIEELLGTVGTVMPMSPVALDIAADVFGLEADPRLVRTIVGQVAVASTPGQVRRVRLIPSSPPATAGVTEKIAAADMVVLGPGSWFTSVIPNVLVPEIAEALSETDARKVLVLNLAPQPGETAGFSTERHLHVLRQHAPNVDFDSIVLDPRTGLSDGELAQVRRTAEKLGAELVLAEVAKEAESGAIRPVHDPAALARALGEIGRSTPAT
ncbi:gluconeogenesis factor YvcK family protein [Dietzia sp.]|uniref:gluconeogenesis factor YvcK family protein n=1 Tax=Dietzia sp. TaxID=1871616 RepID=UPI002FDAADC0